VAVVTCAKEGIGA